MAVRPDSTIMVVDDEPAIRGVLSILLESEGYSVTTAANGQEALVELQHHRPDAIVLDLMMPVMTGWELIDACRADPMTRPLPIIAISAMYGGQTSPQPDVQAFLAKPFDIDRVLDLLQDLLR